jgi:hypothetical protein
VRSWNLTSPVKVSLWPSFHKGTELKFGMRRNFIHWAFHILGCERISLPWRVVAHGAKVGE